MFRKSPLLAPLLLVLAALAPGCSGPSIAEEIDARRIELYELVDAVRPLSPDLAAIMLDLLLGLELLAVDVDALDPSD